MALVLERMTTDARAVLAGTPRFAQAAGQREMTLWDLAEALSARVGNTAGLWRDPPDVPPAGAEPPAAESGAAARFDGETRAVLERAQAVASQERAEHVGTEHLLAALVRTGPPDVVAWLAARGATADAVDALLLRLGGTPGAEGLPDEPPGADRQAAGERVGDRRRSRVVTALVGVLVLVVLFVLCVWGP